MLALLLAVSIGSCSGPVVLSYGDSKTVLRQTLLDDNEDDWQVLLTRLASCRGNFNIGTVNGPMGSWAQNGITVGQRQDVVDSDLAVMGAQPSPTYVLINLGTNDLTAMPVEAAWKADYLYILDAIHTKWPAAAVYCATVWKRNYDTEANTLAGWMATVIAARPDFVRAAFDERTWLKGSDNGATMTNDGIHYSRLGAAECARQWKLILGF